MALAEHEQQVWLLSCLNATLDATPDIRKQAEEALREASLREGYGVALANVVSNTNLAMGLRQLAAVLLKQYVNQHWSDDDKDYISPITCSEDKARIRVLLLPVLGDPQGKIRTAVGMAISRIAVSDWPEQWPNLMAYILECINDRANIDKVRGALRCLALFAGELDDKQVPLLVPVLFPSLYTIVSSPSIYDSSMRKAALVTLHSCMSTLGLMVNGVDMKEVRKQVGPMLKAWMEQFAAILASPVQSENPDDWGLKLEVLKALLQVVQNFGALASKEFPVITQPLWQTVVSGLQVYQVAAIRGDEEVFAGLACSDGSDQSLETLMIQLFEFLVTLVGSPRYDNVIRGNIKDLAYYTIGFIQMTEVQAANWSEDPNHYIADEEDMGCSCRSSGICLLEEAVERHADDVKPVLEAIHKRIEEAELAKANGDADWWKLREAAIFALGSVLGDNYCDPEKFPDIQKFVNNVLSTDIARGYNTSPMLYGRALWGSAKLHSLLTKDNRQQSFAAAVEGLSQNVVPIVVGSFRAISALIHEVDASLYQHAIISFLAHWLQKVSEETLNLILEASSAVLKVVQLPAAESILSPLLLDIWARHVCDPLLGIQALETLEVVKNIPGCLQPFKERVLPYIAGILAQPQNDQPGLLAGALDFTTMLITNSPMEVIRDVYNATFTSIITIMMQSSDHTELQNGTLTLSKFVQFGGENVLKWSPDPNMAMKMLLDVVARIIHPSTDSSSSFFAGRYILQLIQHLSNHMAPHLRTLVEALINRFDSVNLKGSLILVFARLVHMSAPNYGQFIDLLISVPSRSHGNALIAVMTEWTKSQEDISGAYHIKVCVTALASLLASGHPYLSQIRVQGRLVQSVNTGIMTRSRKKVQPDHYTTLMLPEKIFTLLAEALADCYEQTFGGHSEGDDDDDEWEEDDETTDKVVSAVVSNAFKPAEEFQHFLNGDISDDEGDSDDAFEQADPISKINLQEYLEHFMKTFAPQAPPNFLVALSEREKAAVDAALRK